MNRGSGWKALPGLRGLWLGEVRRRNETPARRPTEVEPGVWLGGLPTRRTWSDLEGRGVRRALSLVLEEPPSAWVASAHQLLWLPVADRLPPDAVQLEAGCRFVDAAVRDGEGVFVYCGSGMGRAPTMILAWQLRRSGVEVGSAVAELRRRRPVADPTPDQLRALADWSVAR